MSHHNGPRARSRARRALVELHKAGGQMNTIAFMKLIQWCDTTSEFDRVIVNPLLRYNLVFKRNTTLVISDPGMAFLGVEADAPVSEPVITPATYVPPMRELSRKHMPRMNVIRAGALDYKNIPSVVADRIVPYGAKA